ncbi:MAG: hypothetical protein J6J43_08925 [Oscillospiraceae bacterium]|nr:hypothetical protein [Oscillospiraceae bacterium]
MKYSELKQTSLMSKCRSCINGQYRMKLIPQDLAYLPYQGECRSCGKMSNIVAGVRPASRWKVWLGVSKENSQE